MARFLMNRRTTFVIAGAALVLVGLLLATGCAALTGGNSAWDPFAQASERRLSILVQNPTNMDVAVEAVAGTERTDLGFVGPRSQRQFSIQWQRVETIRFQIEPLGERRYTTPGLGVGPGERVELIIQAPVSRSFVRR